MNSKKLGIETETIQIGNRSIRGCIACGRCGKSEGHFCVFDDDCVNEISAKMREADGFILGSPTYYAAIAGTMKSFLDRVFFSSSRYFRLKVATSVATVRRAGGVDVIHQLNNYLNLAQVVIPPSQYWTMAYGMDKGEGGRRRGRNADVRTQRALHGLAAQAHRIRQRHGGQTGV